jgi:hypothetical protein
LLSPFTKRITLYACNADEKNDRRTHTSCEPVCPHRTGNLDFVAIFSVTTTVAANKDNRMGQCSANGKISANQAKRIVRHYLTELGYTSHVRAGGGGARIGKVRLEDGLWSIQVKLYGTSLARREYRTVFIDSRCGVLAETRTEANLFLTGISN